MTKDISALSQALKRREPAKPESISSSASYYQAPSRAGKLHLSAWLPPDFKSSLRAIQLQHPTKTLQDLHIEALNDLFAKYNVPTVHVE